MPLPFSMRQDYPIAHRTKDRRFSVKGLADIQLDLDDYEEQRRTLMAAREAGSSVAGPLSKLLADWKLALGLRTSSLAQVLHSIDAAIENLQSSKLAPSIPARLWEVMQKDTQALGASVSKENQIVNQASPY